MQRFPQHICGGAPRRPANKVCERKLQFAKGVCHPWEASTETFLWVVDICERMAFHDLISLVCYLLAWRRDLRTIIRYHLHPYRSVLFPSSIPQFFPWLLSAVAHPASNYLACPCTADGEGVIMSSHAIVSSPCAFLGAIFPRIFRVTLWFGLL